MTTKHVPILFVLILSYSCFVGSTRAQTDFWQQTNGPYGGSVNSVAVNSNGHILAAEWTGRIFISRDGGEHWIELANSPAPNLNTFIIAPNGHLFAGTMTGVYRSTDQGSSWTQANSGLTRSEIYELTFDRQGNLYAGSYFGGVYRSGNNGDTWTPLGLIYVESLFATPAGELFAGTNASLYKYTSSGWIQVGPSNTTVNAIAVNPAGHIFVATYYSNGGVLRSTDGGAHWIQTNAGLPQTPSVFSLFISSVGNIFASVYDVLNNRQGAYWSTNNGTSWTQLDLPQCGSFAQTATSEMYAGGNGVYRSTNGGMLWSQTRYTSLGVGSMAVASTNALFAATGRGLFRSTNYGDTWLLLSFPRAGLLATNRSGDVFAASYTVFRSSDNGSTWNPTNTQWESAQAIAFAVSPTGSIFASTTRDISPCPCTVGLFRTTDNGNNWNRIAVDSLAWYIEAIGIHPLSGEIYASSWDKVYRSTNDGNSWALVLSNAPAISAIAVTFTGVVLVAADSGVVYRSSDHGGTWSQVVVTTMPIHSIIMTQGNHVLAASDNGVFRSTNGGVTWTQLNTGLTHLQVLSLAVDNSGYVYAGTRGLGVFRSRFPAAINGDDDTNTPAFYRLEQNYPNPFNPTTEIRFRISEVRGQKSENSHVTLKVYDVLGREVATLVNEEMKPGSYETTWDASGFASGVYFYRLTAGNYVETKKLVLLR
jgi:photosystem II stability/assembly factor-like uncharacterized protein